MYGNDDDDDLCVSVGCGTVDSWDRFTIKISHSSHHTSSIVNTKHYNLARASSIV